MMLNIKLSTFDTDHWTVVQIRFENLRIHTGRHHDNLEKEKNI